MERVVRERHIVGEEFAGERFQEYCIAVMELLSSRSGIKKAIKRGDIFIDGKPAETGRIMVPGMVVELMEGTLPSSKRFVVELPVLYEDSYLAVINKPAGIPVSGNYFKTVQNGLAGNISFSTEPDALAVPRPVHRLDSLTSGILVIAKTSSAQIALGNLFEQRLVKKTYQAICMGETPDSGEIHFPVDGKASHSSFQRMSSVKSLRSGTLSLVQLSPHTGRTHQLRIHCAESGFPIAGDSLYGDRKNTILHRGLFLAATSIAFEHPITKEPLAVSMDLPHKFNRYLENEQKMYNKYRDSCGNPL